MQPHLLLHYHRHQSAGTEENSRTQNSKMVSFQKEYLDLVLVPLGLVIIFTYHLNLLYRVLYHPYTTVMGFMNQDKRIWVERVMEIRKGELSNALTVLSNSISTATFFASVSLTLSSLMGASLGSSSSSNIFTSKIIYGDTRPATMIIKYTSLLACFLLAFSCFVQSVSHFVHANYLITTPGGDVPVEVVETAVVRGGDFSGLGLRALYLAFHLLLWLFGPIPMFVSSVVMVLLLHYLDSNSVPPPLHHQRFEEQRVIKRTNESYPNR